MQAATTLGLLFSLLAAGCAGPHKPATEARAQAEPPIVTQDLPAPADPVATSPTPEAHVDSTVTTVTTVTPPELPVAKPKQAPPTGTAVSTPASRKSAAPGSEAQAQSTAKAAARPAQTPEKPVASAPAVVEPQKKEAPAPAARATEPTLDVADLKSRLRDTKAIGAFTKIALSNQMDDLLKQFRAIYEGRQTTSVTSLRQPYDSLVVKVVTVLKDDPALARTISASREAIWGILSDPVKFKSVT